MLTDTIEMQSTTLDEDLGSLQQTEDLGVQELIPEFAVEA